jgi:hypothetical protein
MVPPALASPKATVLLPDRRLAFGLENGKILTYKMNTLVIAMSHPVVNMTVTIENYRKRHG